MLYLPSGLLVLLLCCCILSVAKCGPLADGNLTAETEDDIAMKRSHVYARFMMCSITMDTMCFMDVADNYLQYQRTLLLAEADREAAGRSISKDEGQTPSNLVNVINKMISELTQMLKDGIGSFFKTPREGEDEVEEDDENETEIAAAATTDTEESRALKKTDSAARKKKKEGLIAAIVKLVKTVILAVAIFLAVKILIKLMSAALQIKFFVVALLGLLLNAARFYFDLKKNKHPPKVIYYEHAHHQHHYDGLEEDWGSSGPGEEHWGRTYDDDDKTAHDLAYAKQKPSGYYKTVNKKPSSSWFDW